MMTSWKTSLLGVSGILSSVVGILQHVSDGTPIDINQHVTEIMLAVGLLVAKDHDATGGTRVWKGRDSLTDSERGTGYDKK